MITAPCSRCRQKLPVVEGYAYTFGRRRRRIGPLQQCLLICCPACDWDEAGHLIEGEFLTDPDLLPLPLVTAEGVRRFKDQKQQRPVHGDPGE